ncbi:hypothetical protein BDCR2A_01599 [Borrelia duttonii CR2A]|uniref:Uncharacterized protein n=1 Tax=Borrelia duttonii CR2A TaxID=1432657 RepID=W6TJV4_9SPIR|nr:hypothetical protein BDCR2A_01599 [Borrelia duttonii CR2A]
MQYCMCYINYILYKSSFFASVIPRKSIKKLEK